MTVARKQRVIGQGSCQKIKMLKGHDTTGSQKASVCSSSYQKTKNAPRDSDCDC